MRYPGNRLFRIFVAIFSLLSLLLGAALLGSLSPSTGTPEDLTYLGIPSPGSPTREDRPASGGCTPAVEGWVVSALGGTPVQGAAVSAAGQEVTTDEKGYFCLSVAQLGLAANARDAQPLSVRVQRDGYAAWQIENAIYYPGDTLRLYPRLAQGDQEPVLLEAASRRVRLGELSRGLDHSAPQLTEAGTETTFQQTALPVLVNSASAGSGPPATIRIYRTGTGAVEVVPFRDYVKHTLPNEWIPSWNSEALRAGAMAVKHYAWFWISRGGKRASMGADLKDNVDDQVYDPNVSYASTDAAVDATFSYSLTRGGALFQTQYCAGSYDPDPAGDCPWPAPYMTQWGSSYHADQGRPWGWIVQFYYPGTVISPTPPGANAGGAPAPTRVPPTRTPVVFTLGQGSSRPELFREAYERNGGLQLLGRPTGPVRWWLPYDSDKNVLAQPFAGAQGRGGVWIVYDALRADASAEQRAFVLSGPIAAAYSGHTPPGPEWVGAPTSDQYSAAAELGGHAIQSFTGGTLRATTSGVELTPWPVSFTGWKAEFFVGALSRDSQLEPPRALPGQPSMVLDRPSPDLDWPAEASLPQAHGVGLGAWSAQFTRQLDLPAGSYDFNLEAEGGVRLWVNELLAVNGWTNGGRTSQTYNADLPAGSHTFRIQYRSDNSAALLKFGYTQRQQPAAPGAGAATGAEPAGGGGPAAALRIKVRWLGRGPAPSELWVQQLTLKLSDPENNRYVTQVEGATDRYGVAFYGGLPPGTYNVHVKGAHTLQTARASVTLRPGAATELDMQAQIEGDIDGDNCVTIQDYVRIQRMVGTHAAVPGFDPTADLNGDGFVSVGDVSLLRSGFERCGDISADTGFRVMSTGAAPSLSQMLAPWTNPERLKRNLEIAIVGGQSSVRAGDIAELLVVAEAGAQPVDGAAFLLKFDPEQLQLVDAAGKPAGGVEPGLALPSVIGNWSDPSNGAIGYAAGMLQSDPPGGRFVIAKARFRVLSAGPDGRVLLRFAPAPSDQMQLTNGGTNLLAAARDYVLTISP